MEYRIREHPILCVVERSEFTFLWDGRTMIAREGDTIASALFANGVRVFGHHPKDHAPQGMFCANGQCAQCTVTADGLPVKACMTAVRRGMSVASLSGHPVLPTVPTVPELRPIETVEVECLVIGGGPAGLSAAIELGHAGVRTLLVDDKHRVGGKLVLQTHKFFGSIDACYAGTRGIDIATTMAQEVRQFENVQVWLRTTAVAVFSDRKVGVLRDGRYAVVQANVLLIATGARERALVFRGCTLPGVYGAGAFQTLVNRDLVRPSRRLFIVGGGNVGLIAGYHALQARIEVTGLCEALPDCSGYKVHRDKLARLGVPIYTSHVVLSADGAGCVESVTIAQVDEGWRSVPGTEKTIACDTVLVAVGLDPVDEFLRKARAFGLPAYAAGDAEEISEASAAMFVGRIRGLEIARSLGRDVGEIPQEWYRTADILKSRPGAVVTEDLPEVAVGVLPVLHCAQEIPCNPCVAICPKGCIVMEGEDLRALPEYGGKGCSGCGRCVAICPGQAITLVDYRQASERPRVTLPFELPSAPVAEGDVVTAVDTVGNVLGPVTVCEVRAPRFADRTLLVQVRAPAEIARQIAGLRVQEPVEAEAALTYTTPMIDDEIICRCERVTVGQVREVIRSGVTDVNYIKAVTRAGMGACGGKTCFSLIRRLFAEEGISQERVTEGTQRPLFVEVPLGAFAGVPAEDGLTPEQPIAHATDAHTGGL